jgi:hypothetical protein
VETLHVNRYANNGSCDPFFLGLEKIHGRLCFGLEERGGGGVETAVEERGGGEGRGRCGRWHMAAGATLPRQAAD